MAATAINLVSTNDVNTASAGFTLTAGTIADGFKVEMGGKDYKTTFIAHSTGASDVTLTVAVGDSARAAQEPLVTTVPAGKYVVFTLDSGYYLQTKGANKGYVLIGTSATTCELGVVETR